MAVMATIVFFGLYGVGNPVDLLINPEADLAEQEATIRRLGLDKPVHVQFGYFLSGLAQGDLGTSFVHNRPALELILSRLPATLELAFLRHPDRRDFGHSAWHDRGFATGCTVEQSYHGGIGHRLFDP